MLLTIHSGQKISAETIEKIRDIFKNSQCPNESLLNSIPEVTKYDGKQDLYLSPGETHTDVIEV